MAEASDANTSEPPYTVATFRALRALGVYALEKPAIFGALAYFYVSAIGLLYNVVYFNYFDMDVVSFYEAGDFLLSGLRRPLLLLVPIGLITVAILYGIVTFVLDRAVARYVARLPQRLPSGSRLQSLKSFARRYAQLDDWMQERTKRVIRPAMLTIYVVASFAFSVSLVVVWAKRDASRFFLEKPPYCVRIEDGETKELSKTPLYYLGSTQAAYLFHSGPNLPGLPPSDLYVIPRARIRMLRVEYESRACDATREDRYR